MDDFLLQSLFLVIIPLLLLYAAGVVLRRRRPYPPGPKGFPIIGNMNMMNKLTHRGLAELAKKYGGFLHLRIGFIHIAAVSSPEIARQVLQVHDHVFANRPATNTISYLTYDRADMAFANYGPFWRQMRKLCVVKLFSRKRAESWASVRDEVDKLVRAVDTQMGRPVNLGEHIFTVTRNIIYRAAFGSDSEDGQDEFIKILQEFSKLFGASNLTDFIPCLGWVGQQGLNKRLKNARESLDRFVDAIIDEHIERRKAGKEKGNNLSQQDQEESDMVDEMLEFYSEEAKVDESADLQSSIRLTRDNIKAIIMDVMFGGTETVASAIEWSLAELFRSPEDLKRVQEELSETVGLDKQRVEDTHLDKLPFLKCVVKETLRLHPPIPLLLHETAEDSTVSGYFLPKGSRVMVNAWAIARDPNSWVDAEEFRPGRFMDTLGMPDFKGGNFEFIPFGSGRRSCPGMQLGLYGLELAVANLLHCFEWELPDGMKPSELDMSDVFGLTAPRAKRLFGVPSKRLICPI